MTKSKLYTPLTIGSIEVKNRVMMAPMSTGFEPADGTLSEPIINYWVERAKGGVGLIIIGAVTIDSDVPYQTPQTISLGDDKFIPGFKELTDRCHAYGAKVMPQIAYMGAESCNPWFKGIEAVGPSSYVNAQGFQCREMRLDEIPPIIKKYGETALRAKKAGCDGVQVHCAHAYMMLGAFLSPLRNKRTDKYGGSLDNRARLALEVIREIRSVVGEDFPIMLRFSGDERTPGGLDINDWLYLLPKFEEAGVDAFEVSGGNPYEVFDLQLPCHYSKPGVNLEEAKKIKAISNKPVYVVGKINDAKFAEYVVDSGYADAVSMGRPLLAEANLVNFAREGKYEDIAPCASCGGACITRSAEDMAAHCIINPALGREVEWAIRPLEGEAKHVVVVGAGPSGLSAARVAALRGHRVTVLEKNFKVGGQLALASVPPNKQDLSKWAVYLLTQCERLGVTFKYEVDATAEVVLAEKPDLVITATGSDPIVIDKMPGFDTLEKVVTAQDILAGKAQALRGKVAILGGGLTACETADYLSLTSRGDIDITVIEMMPAVVPKLTPANRIPLLRALSVAGVKVRTNTKVMEFKEKDIIVEHNGELEVLSGFDHIIWALGVRSRNPLASELESAGVQVVSVGDADSVGDCRSAIESGYAVANRI